MRERFAPSPTGFLHLGHAFSVLTARDSAQANKGEFLLRIEDIDKTRSRLEFEQSIYDDLAWLGLSWPHPVMRQSERMDQYRLALNILICHGLCYPCLCTRHDIADALSAPQEGGTSQYGPDGLVYPGTCRHREFAGTGRIHAIRLDMWKAIAFLGGEQAVNRLTWMETGENFETRYSLNAQALQNDCGDVVLARRDIGTSYHLSVVVDDAAQNITNVTRGQDMQNATQIHRLLQSLLGLPTPVYRHHRLIRDEHGKRLAKRDDARAIRQFRINGATPSDIRHMVGL